MGIFENWCEKYFNSGFSVIPIHQATKRPSIRNWQEFSKRLPSKNEIDFWMRNFGDHNIGIVLGEASGIVAFDYDYDWNEKLSKVNKKKFDIDKSYIETNVIDKFIADSPVKKTGKKGWTAYYKWNPNLKNISCDRYSIRCFDFLVNGRQTVIPPSIHPDTGNQYIWINDDLLGIDIDDFPEISQDSIHEIKDLLSLSNSEGLGGRHGELFKYISSVSKVIHDPVKIAKKAIVKDSIINSKKPYFKDPSHINQHKNIEAQAIDWVKRILSWNEINSKLNNTTNPVGYDSYECFFQEKFPKASRDIVDGVLKVKEEKLWKPLGNNRDAIKSWGSDIGLAPDRTVYHFKRFEAEFEKSWLFKEEAWDGRDHIAEILVNVCVGNMKNPEMIDLWKYWFSNIFKRYYEASENSIIVLQGPQGIGKDLLISNLLKGFRPYFNNFTDAAQEKDLFMQNAKNLCINVSEFDRLHRKHPGLIKDLISRDSAQFRPSHMQYHEDFQMISSFIGSTNTTDFLTDYTGNRRFYIFELTDIDWSYPKDRSAQIVAQSRALWKEGYKPKKDSIDAMTEYIKTQTPDNPIELLVDMWNCGLDAASKSSFNREDFRFDEVSDLFRSVARDLNFSSTKRVQGIIKRLGGQCWTHDGRRYRKIVVSQHV